MNGNFLQMIANKPDYLMVLEAYTGEKTAFSEEEKAKLLEIYADNAKGKFGFEAETLVRAVLALDVPAANLLDKADADALAGLSELCRDWQPDVTKAKPVQDAALCGDVSEPLALAMARAALDAYAGQDDIAPHREDIAALADYLKQADEAAFSEASAFLIRVRERVRA